MYNLQNYLSDQGFSPREIAHANDQSQFPLFQNHRICYLRNEFFHKVLIAPYVLMDAKDCYFDYLVFIVKETNLSLDDMNALTSKFQHADLIQSPSHTSALAIFARLPKMTELSVSSFQDVYEECKKEVERIVDEIVRGRPALSSESCKIEEIIKVSEKALQFLQITNYEKGIINRTRNIQFANNNIGMTALEYWKNSNVCIEVNASFIVLRISFFYNSPHQEIDEDLILRYLHEFIVEANPTIPFGSFSILNARKIAEFSVSCPHYLTKYDYLKETIIDYLRLGTAIYKSYGWALGQIVESIHNSIKIDINCLTFSCLRRFEKRKEHFYCGLKPDRAIRTRKTKEKPIEENNKRETGVAEGISHQEPPNSTILENTGNTTLKRAISHNEFNSNDIRKMLDFIMELYKQNIIFRDFPVKDILYRYNGNDRTGSPDAKFQLKEELKCSSIGSNEEINPIAYKNQMLVSFQEKLFKIKKHQNSFTNIYECIPAINFDIPKITSRENKYASGEHNEIYTNCLHGSQVAIKLPKEVKNSKEREKAKKAIIREYFLMKQLSHKNILRTYGLVLVEVRSNSEEKAGRELELEDCAIGLVTDLCPAENLGNYSTCGRNNDICDKLGKSLGLAKALQFIHMKEIIHLNVNPDTVLMNYNKDIILSNFSRSQQLNQLRTVRTGNVLDFHSPAQIRGDINHIDRSCDIWSYAMTVYYLIVGQYPYYYLKENGKIINKAEFLIEIDDRMRYPQITHEFEREHPGLVQLLRSGWNHYSLVPSGKSYKTSKLVKDISVLINQYM